MLFAIQAGELQRKMPARQTSGCIFAVHHSNMKEGNAATAASSLVFKSLLVFLLDIILPGRKKERHWFRFSFL
jgi:hypothetical protein